MSFRNAAPNNEVQKSTEDRRTYRAFELPNGIRVLLISDVENERSEAAAALCVGVGHFADPKNVPGMAHYVEHLVCLNCITHQERTNFRNFVTQRGGFLHATTCNQHTVYSFNVQREYFCEALKRFAKLFKKPAACDDHMKSEAAAIQSELALFKRNDDYIFFFLLESLAKQDHPRANFIWGHSFFSKELPSTKLNDMFNEIQKFYGQNYSSRYMTLAVEVSGNPDEVENWIHTYFSSIRQNDSPQPSYKKFGDAFETKEFNKLYKVYTQKTTKRLNLTWSLPFESIEHYLTKPSHYVDKLITGTDPGSLEYYLGEKMWALNLFTNCKKHYYEKNETGYLFTVALYLTAEGYRKLYEVITAVFQYLKMLRTIGPRKELFDNIKNEKTRDFTLAEPSAPRQNVKRIARAMQVYPPNHYLTGSSQMFLYDEEVISQFLQRLTPQRCNVAVESQSHDDVYGGTFVTQHLYGFQYHVSDFKKRWVSYWNKLPDNLRFELPDHLVDNSMQLQIKLLGSTRTLQPTKVEENTRMKMWFMQDSLFRRPRGYIYLHFLTPSVCTSVESQALLDILIRIMNFRLNNSTISTSLSYMLRTTHGGISFKICGFDIDISQNFAQIIDVLFSKSTIDFDFEALKEELIEAYSSEIVHPVSLAWDLLSHLTVHRMWTMQERGKAVLKLSLSDVTIFMENFLKDLKVEGFVYGNFKCEEAKIFAAYINYKMDKGRPAFTPEIEENVVTIPEGSRYCRVSNFNDLDMNTTLLNYYQIGHNSIRTYVLARLLANILDQNCFNVLRQRERLSYDVSTMLHVSHNMLGIVIKVELLSTANSIRSAERKIDQYLMEFNERLTTVHNDFSIYVTSLITKLQSPFLTMEEEADHYWEEITDQTYLFNRRNLEVREAEELSLRDLQNLFESTMVTSRRRKLSIQVASKGMTEQSQIIAKLLLNNLPSADPNILSLRQYLASKIVSLPTGVPLSFPQISNLQYLQETQFDRSVDQQSIFNTDSFKRSQQPHSTRQVLEDLLEAGFKK